MGSNLERNGENTDFFEQRRAVIKGLFATGFLASVGCRNNGNVNETGNPTPLPTGTPSGTEVIPEPPTLTPQPTVVLDQEPTESNYFESLEQLVSEYHKIRDQYWQTYGIDPQIQNIELSDEIPDSDGIIIIGGFMPNDQPWAKIDMSNNLYLKVGALEKFQKEDILSILYFASAISLIREDKKLNGGERFYGFSDISEEKYDGEIIRNDRLDRFFISKAYAFILANNVSLKGPHSINSILTIIRYYPPDKHRYMTQGTLMTFLLLEVAYKQTFFNERDMYDGLAGSFSKSHIIEFLQRLLKKDDPLVVADLKNFKLLYEKTRERYLSKEGLFNILFSYLNKYGISVEGLGPETPKVDPLGDTI